MLKRNNTMIPTIDKSKKNLFIIQDNYEVVELPDGSGYGVYL